MAHLIDVTGDPDFKSQCSECGVKFTLIWDRGRGDVLSCPFCGDDIDEDD